MVRIIKKSKISKPIITIGIVTLLCIAGGSAYWYYSTRHTNEQTKAPSTPTQQIDYREATDDQKTAGSAIKEQVVTSQQQESAPSTSVNMTITSTDKSSDTLHIRTLIDKVTNTGNCTLSMTGPSSKTYSASAKVQAIASSSTCAGFDIPLSSLSSGVWKITVTFSDGTSSGSASSEVTL